jgi:hypothetical protein
MVGPAPRELLLLAARDVSGATTPCPWWLLLLLLDMPDQGRHLELENFTQRVTRGADRGDNGDDRRGWKERKNGGGGREMDIDMWGSYADAVGWTRQQATLA